MSITSCRGRRADRLSWVISRRCARPATSARATSCHPGGPLLREEAAVGRQHMAHDEGKSVRGKAATRSEEQPCRCRMEEATENPSPGHKAQTVHEQAGAPQHRYRQAGMKPP